MLSTRSSRIANYIRLLDVALFFPFCRTSVNLGESEEENEDEVEEEKNSSSDDAPAKEKKLCRF